MNEPMPTFLMVGAAKSGTTSIYQHLREHPDIFMPENKEPNYFVRSLYTAEPNMDQISTRETYTALYAGSDRFKARGDACVHNLYYHEIAIPEIRKLLGDIKIIIALRNPVDRAWSQYSSMASDHRFDSFESCLEFEASDSFRKAFEGSDGSSTEEIPAWADRNYLYVSWSSYYAPVTAYMENFSNVEIVLFEDLRNDAATTIARLYRFLDVDDSFTPGIGESYNVSIAPRNKVIWWLMEIYKRLHIGGLITAVVSRVSGPDRALQLKARLFAFVAPVISKKRSIRPETRTQLKEKFRADTLKLQTLIKRDLSSWL